MNLDTLIKSHHAEKAAEAEIFEITGSGVHGPERVGTDPTTRLETLRSGLSALDDMVEASDVVQFFLGLVRGLGGRLVLMRQWSTGLRALLSEGVQLSERLIDPEARRPRLIPLDDDDVFAVVAREKVVYSGPFPRDNFPKELARELGGDENRPVLVIPLPLRGRWETFLFIDWVDFRAAERIDEATLLARYAVLRLHCAENDQLPIGTRTQEILAGERARQRERVKAGYDDLKPGDLPPERIYGMVGELTAMPQMAGRILKLLSDPSTTAVQLEKEIVKDLVLTAKILRIANSSFYESISEVKTIRDAIVRLGFKSVRNWTLVNASQTAFPGVDSNPIMNRIWVQSIRSAYGAQLAAEAAGYEERETMFVGGLIQNIGQLVLARALPGLYEKLVETATTRGEPVWRVEQEVLGYDHGSLGAQLIEAWGLSPEVAHAVMYHHQLERDPDVSGASAIVALGEELATLTGVEDADVLQAAWEASEAARRLEVELPVFLEMLEKVAEADTEACS